MPVNATFNADFTSFYDAVNKATAALGTLDAEAAKVNTTVAAMPAPTKVQQAADAAGAGAVQARNLAQSYRDFDKVLASVGVQAGTTVGAIEDIANAAGKTAAELGLVSTAALGVGAAMAGWQLGRAIAGWLGLDEAIGKATAALLGWGDTAAQQAGSIQDVLDRATKNAGRTITDYTEAITINTEAARQHNLTLATAENRVMNYEAAIEKVAKAGNFQQMTEDMRSQLFTTEELSKRYNISAEALTYLSNEMKRNADDAKAESEAVDELFKVWKAGGEIMKDFAIKTHAIAMKAMQEERTERAKMLAEQNKMVIDGYTAIKAAQEAINDDIAKKALSDTDYKIYLINKEADARIAAFHSTAEQEAQYRDLVLTHANEEIAALKNVTTAVQAVGDEYSAMYKQATEGVLIIGHSANELAQTQQDAAMATGDTVVSEYDRQIAAFESFKGVVVAGTGEMSAAVAAAMGGGNTPSDVLQREWAMQQAQRDRGEIFLTGTSGARLGVQTRATGGPVTVGQTYLVGEHGPELFKPAASGNILPTAGGGGVTMHNTFNINGSVRDLAQPLIEELTRLMHQTRQWPSA